jgi:hypothetical protein
VKIILTPEAIFAGWGRHRGSSWKGSPLAGLALFAGFNHRFNDARDLCACCWRRAPCWTRPTAREFFRRFGRLTITLSLIEFSAAPAMDYPAVFGSRRPCRLLFPFFFPSPATGSACKRLCMFLRWMVRPDDGIDLGLWHEIPGKTDHPGRCAYPRIAISASPAASRAIEDGPGITAALRKLDPPTRSYDFSSATWGYPRVRRQGPLQVHGLPVSTLWGRRHERTPTVIFESLTAAGRGSLLYRAAA